MDNTLTEFMNNRFSLDREGTDDKVMPLSEAVQRFIRPEMMIHLAFPAYHRANALVREIIRQYWGKKPEFTFMCVGFGVQNFAPLLFYGGLLRKAVSTFFGDAYPTPGPNPIFVEANQKGEVEFEHWSILTFAGSLLAGAMGIGFMPTNSLIGSSMAEDNNDTFQVIDDPFHAGVQRGIVKAVNPDVSLIHGLAADRHGNTIIAPPYSENIYGAYASKTGAMVTVERLVSTEFIRKYSHMVRLPGNVVRSVSVVPFGAHPLGVSSAGVPEIDVYADDYDFLMDARKVCRDKAKLDEWIEKWVLGCPDQDEYLRRLGGERVLHLKGKASPDAWRYDSEAFAKVDQKSDYNPSEMMTIAMARCLMKKILDNQYTTILAGIGQANLAAWLANYQLKELHDYPLNLIAEVGMYGYAPRPGDPFVFNHGNVPTAKLLTDSFQTLGMMVAGENNTCIGALGTGMVDKEGNMNSTVVSPNILISGSGGGNDTATGAREVIASLAHSRERIVDRVPYVTCPGTRVRTVVTTLGVLEKLGEDRELTLTQLLPSVENPSVEERIHEIKEKTGWELKVHPDIRFMAQPKKEELVMARLFDPHGYFIGR